jgi:pimeloyl-ACP methyl ester carboxylesterase
VARAKIGEVELEYEVTGEGEPLVLVMGIGAQMIFWDDALIDRFVAAGFQVIRFDHRDIGLSSRLDHLPVPRPGQVVMRSLLGLPVAAPYTLSHMAADIVGLLDHLGHDRAHAVGVSMGGMLAQHLAIEHPHRLHTMTSIMSTTGRRAIWPSELPRPSALRALFAPAPRSAEQSAENVARLFAAIGTVDGRLDAEDEARIRRLGRQAYERGMSPRGFLRHFAAIGASGDRTERLRGVRTPTLVIHGADDPLLRVAGGRATARAIPGARYLELAGMAHFIGRARWDEIAGAIIDHARRHGTRRAA